MQHADSTLLKAHSGACVPVAVDSSSPSPEWRAREHSTHSARPSAQPTACAQPLRTVCSPVTVPNGEQPLAPGTGARQARAMSLCGSEPLDAVHPGTPLHVNPPGTGGAHLILNSPSATEAAHTDPAQAPLNQALIEEPECSLMQPAEQQGQQPTGSPPLQHPLARSAVKTVGVAVGGGEVAGQWGQGQPAATHSEQNGGVPFTKPGLLLLLPLTLGIGKVRPGREGMVEPG